MTASTYSHKILANAYPMALFVVFLIVLTINLVIPNVGHAGISPRVPKIKSANYAPGALRDNALLIGVQRDGKIFFRSDLLDLSSRIKSAASQSSDRKLYIRADVSVRYRTGKHVLDAAHDAGIQQVTFIAEQPHTSTH